MTDTEQIAENELIWDSARALLGARGEFAVCRLPGCGALQLFCGRVSADDVTAGETFEIGEWLQPYGRRIVLRGANAADVEAGSPTSAAETAPPELVGADEEISHEDYLRAVEAIARDCRKREGKTVYSRVILGENPRLDIIAAARKLFAIFPQAFCFLYYTSATGCWLGATPEILLDADLRSRAFSTMALAGTRSDCGSDPWDDKNMTENSFVADYIVERLAQLGIDATVTAPFTVGYGSLQHLRRDIYGGLPETTSVGKVIDAINPTPALCGVPIEAALADIDRHELHRRRCYGGFVAVRMPDRYRAFVNLRSCRLGLSAVHPYAVFAGGGIVGASVPESEWFETCRKAASLLGILAPSSEA